MADRITVLVFTLAFLALATAARGADLLWQTNAGGDDIHIFDAETGDLVRRLVVGENPHGLASATGNDTVFVSLERNGAPAGELLWIDKRSFEIEHRLEVGREPHAIAVTPDGRWVYVPCRDGTYWVIDAVERTVVTRIETGGRPHNTTVSPDGKRVYLSPMGTPKRVTIVAPQEGHKVVGAIEFSQSVRPPALAASRGLFFQHVDGLNGFEAADLETGEVITQVRHDLDLGWPVIPKSAGFLGRTGLSRCHGLAVRPGDREIWSLCGAHAVVHDLTDRTFTQVAHIGLPGKAYWMCFSRDGKTAFIALSGNSEVAKVDAVSRKVLKILRAGKHPKRNLVISY